MNRSSRVHKSTKIPNVKLRPAPVPDKSDGPSRVEREAARRQVEREDAQHYRMIRRAAAGGSAGPAGAHGSSHGAVDKDGDGEDEEDDDFEKPDALPLTGVVVCFSSITDHDERLNLTRSAVQLGARVESDLREDVHYLICGNVGSAKYHEALERGKAIVRPSWLVEVRNCYQHDRPYEWDKLLASHRLRPLQGFHIVFTGLPNKMRAIEKAQELGARVSVEINAENGITHVVSGTDQASESKLVSTLIMMQNGYHSGTMRNEMARRVVEEVKIVWPEWLQDCERACGALRETRYSLWRPRPTIDERTQIVQTIRDHYVGGSDQPSVTFHADLARTAAQRPIHQKAQLRSKSAFPVGAGHRSTSSPLVAAKEESRPQPALRAKSEGGSTSAQMAKEQRSELLSQSRLGRFSEPAKPDAQALQADAGLKRKANNVEDAADGLPPTKSARAGGEEARANPFARIGGPAAASRSPFAMLNESLPSSSKPARTASPALQESVSSATNSTFLRKYKFRIRLSDERHVESAQEFLEGYGATVISASDVSTKADFTVVPLFYPFDPLPQEGQLVTKLFIERCEWEERIVPFSSSLGLQPSPHNAPVEGASNLVVYFTGFHHNDIEQPQAEAIITAAGGRTSQQFSRKTCSHLICSEAVLSGAKESDKVSVAKTHGVQVVGLDFVKRLMELGKVDPPCPLPRARSMGSRSLSDSCSMLGSTQSESIPKPRRNGSRSPSKSESPSKPERPLQGIRLAWTATTTPNLKFKAEAQALGAVLVPLGDSTTTHLLHQGALSGDYQAGVVSARTRAVHPQWLRACLATRQHAVEELYPVDLGRPAPIVEATQQALVETTALRPVQVQEQCASDDSSKEEGAASSPAPVLKASSDPGNETSPEDPAFAFALPDTCGETARVMAALNADVAPAALASTGGANGAAATAGRRKLRPQRALGRTTSTGSAPDLQATEKDKAAVTAAPEGRGATTEVEPDSGGWATQMNIISETPPVAARIGYEDDGQKERARLLAALERDQAERERSQRSDHEAGGHTGKSTSSGPSSKHRIQARRQPGSRW